MSEVPLYSRERTRVVCRFEGSGFAVSGFGFEVDGCAGPVVPSFRALSGRLKFTVRRHKFNKDSLSG